MQDKSSQRAALGRLVIGNARSWRKLVDQALAEHGLSEAMGLPLLVLLRSDHVRRQCDIADALHLERPALVRVIDVLVAEGYVSREEDPADRRAKVLSLTKSGRSKALAIEKTADSLRQRILASISEADLQVTIQTLQTAEHNLHALVVEQARK
jgi:MarR family transcriptional regulator for hemolysin